MPGHREPTPPITDELWYVAYRSSETNQEWRVLLIGKPDEVRARHAEEAKIHGQDNVMLAGADHLVVR